MFPRNVFPSTSEINDAGHLVIGGCDAVDLAAEFGTPLYIFDEATLRGRCRSFVREFTKRHPNTTVAYASKAYVNPAVAQIFASEGLGLDVVSGGELAVAQMVDFPKELVYFHGSNKAAEELEQAVEWRIGRIVIDSFHELSLLDESGGCCGRFPGSSAPGVPQHRSPHSRKDYYRRPRQQVRLRHRNGPRCGGGAPSRGRS